MTDEMSASDVKPSSAALIVEDNPIIALDTQMMLEEIDFAPVVVLNKLSDGLDALTGNLFSFVILDVRMGDETSLKFARLLIERGTRFVFASGYGDTDTLPHEFKSHALLSKPYTKEQILEFL
jgi:DNA-binding NtrC family response regulator